MKPDQIKEAAIEAAHRHLAFYQIPLPVLRAAIDAYEKAMPPRAVWTYDTQVNAHYFATPGRNPPPYKTQTHVEAIIDVAHDGTLAGVEIIDPRTPRPPEQTV